MFMSKDLYEACVPGARVNWVPGNNPDHNAVYDEEGSCSHTWKIEQEGLWDFYEGESLVDEMLPGPWSTIFQGQIYAY